MLINGIAIGSLYALVAVGFAIIYTTTRIFHIAHGATYIVAGYTYYFLVVRMQMHPLIALAASFLIAVIFGGGLQHLVYRPMQRTEASFFTVFVAAFGVIIVAENVIALMFGSGFATIPSSLSRGMSVGGLVIPPVHIISILLAIILFSALHWFMSNTRTGISLKAMADSKDLVEIVGLDRNRYSVIAFLLGSILVVPSVVLMLYYTGIEPAVSHRIAIIAVASTIVGGIGSLPGTAIGALLLGLAENIGIWQLPSSWKGAIAFGLLFLFIIVRPSGLLPRR